jgi:hypothetical protein
MTRANPLRFPRFIQVIQVLPGPLVCGATGTNSGPNDCHTTIDAKARAERRKSVSGFMFCVHS